MPPPRADRPGATACGEDLNYLFGAPVRPSAAGGDAPRELFVLGAYPSALHVRWQVPGRKRAIAAIAVGDEPEPFWNGCDQLERIARWKADIGFRPAWGEVGGCGRLNGSSGLWLERCVFAAFGVGRAQAWITDCLDTYFESDGARARLAQPAIAHTIATAGITPARHRPHPCEDDIVREALALHADRLGAALRAAAPRRVVTLGRAALRVMAVLTDRQAPALSAQSGHYGTPLRLDLPGGTVEWFALAHPGAPMRYQQAHAHWLAARSAGAAPSR